MPTLTIKELAMELGMSDVELMSKAKERGTLLSTFSRLTEKDVLKLRRLIRPELYKSYFDLIGLQNILFEKSIRSMGTDEYWKLQEELDELEEKIRQEGMRFGFDKTMVENDLRAGDEKMIQRLEKEQTRPPSEPTEAQLRPPQRRIMR